jgi:hypothetical protein
LFSPFLLVQTRRAILSTSQNRIVTPANIPSQMDGQGMTFVMSTFWIFPIRLKSMLPTWDGKNGEEMEQLPPRIARERNTLEKMAHLYCHPQHGSPPGELCADCAELIRYAEARLLRCPFQERKPTCAKCTVHCYKPAMREQVRAMMRYAGPRMLARHPLLAVQHLIDGLRKPPAMKKKDRRGS